MANVDDLKQSITELPREQAINLLLDIRQARRLVVESKVRRRAQPKTTKPKKSKNALLSVIGGMTPEQAQKLIEELKG